MKTERLLSAVFPSTILKENKSTRFKLKLSTDGYNRNILALLTASDSSELLETHHFLMCFKNII